MIVDIVEFLSGKDRESSRLPSRASLAYAPNGLRMKLLDARWLSLLLMITAGGP
jgi:hypothetical protein